MKKYTLLFRDRAKIDVGKYKASGEKPAYKKLVKLLAELEVHPRTGKPERLRGQGERDVWSRRITEKHRLIYEIQDEVVIVLVLAAYGNYEDE